MVEALIAEGMTPEEVEQYLVSEFAMTPADAALYVNTALYGSGDVELVADADLIPIDDTEALITAAIGGDDEDALEPLSDEREPRVITVQPIVHITMPEQPAPVIHVTMPEQPATVVNVDPVVIPAPEVTVNVEQPPAPEVTVNMPSPAPRRVEFQRDASGRIVGGEITEEDA